MSNFGQVYRRAKKNVREAFDFSPQEANAWLIQHTNLQITGKGIYTKVAVHGDKPLERIQRLAGPHGRTLARMLQLQQSDKARNDSQ